MNDEEIIKNLKSEDSLRPQNEVFYSNLKKRLINQRQRQLLNRAENTHEDSQEEHRLFTLPFNIALLSVAIIAIIAVATIVYPTTQNNKVIINSPNANNGSKNKIEIVIDGEKVIANEYEIDNSFVKIALPEEWQFSNSEQYNLENGSAAEFLGESKQMLVTQELSQNEFENIKSSEGSEVVEIAGFEVIKLEKQIQSFETKYNNNYLVKPNYGVSSVILSFEKSNEDSYINALIENLKFENPFENFEKYEDELINYYLPNYWNSKDELYSYNIISKGINFELKLNLGRYNEEIIDSENSKLYYGREIQEEIDFENEIIRQIRFKEYDTSFEFVVGFECPQDDSVCSIDEVESAYESISEDVKLFISSININENILNEDAFSIFFDKTLNITEDKSITLFQDYIFQYKLESELYDSRFIVLESEKFDQIEFLKLLFPDANNQPEVTKLNDWNYFQSDQLNTEVYIREENNNVFILLSFKPVDEIDNNIINKFETNK